MKLFAVLVAALALVPGALAGGYQTAVLSPVEDVSMPFMCNWGYDWDERCYRDDFDRLELGGAGGRPQWVVWDVTDQVADWLSGGSPNYGLLLKLVDEHESYDLPGPAFPSSSYADPAQRPKLVVDYMS